MSAPYFPHSVFASDDRGAVRGMVSAHRYLQGSGTLKRLGAGLASMGCNKAGLLITDNGLGRVGPTIEQSLADAGLSSVVTDFGGECSLEQIEASVADLSGHSVPVDCLIAVGGGKCIDAGKCIAWRLEVPLVVVPTLASTDAPCSAVSVLYTPDGVASGAEFFPDNPAMVVMDSDILVAAPPRFLVAGMGDALATWYEARMCLTNPQAGSVLGCRPTLAAAKIGELCSQTIYQNGEAALEAAKSSQITEAFENVVEANTLHSGIGFESGGLAAAHAVATALTVVHKVDRAAMHGEMVALGILVQLALEKDEDEYAKAASFFQTVGLPVHFGQICLDVEADREETASVIEASCQHGFMANMSVPIDEALLLSVFQDVDQRGRALVAAEGDAAFAALRD